MVTILWFLVKLWLTISENECWSFRGVCVYAKSLHLFPGYLKEGKCLQLPLIGNSQREPGHDVSTSVLGCFAWRKIPHATLDCPAGVPECASRSFVTDSLWPHGLCSPWNFPGQNTGVGSLSLLQGNLPHPGIKPRSPTFSGEFFTSWTIRETQEYWSG